MSNKRVATCMAKRGKNTFANKKEVETWANEVIRNDKKIVQREGQYEKLTRELKEEHTQGYKAHVHLAIAHLSKSKLYGASSADLMITDVDTDDDDETVIAYSDEDEENLAKRQTRMIGTRMAGSRMAGPSGVQVHDKPPWMALGSFTCHQTLSMKDRSIE